MSKTPKHSWVKTFEKMNAGERNRLDRMLTCSEVPITLLASRFGMSTESLHKRLRELGFSVKRPSLGTQERLPLLGKGD